MASVGCWKNGQDAESLKELLSCFSSVCVTTVIIIRVSPSCIPLIDIRRGVNGVLI